MTSKTGNGALVHRYDFTYFYEVTNGNPNGDPDAGNLPRTDPETGNGLVSDVCLKRKLRNYTALTKANEPGYAIYVQEAAILNDRHRQAYAAVRSGGKAIATAKKLNPQDDDEAMRLTRFMCENFFDIRAFGAVMATDINCGQVRGPVQLGFSRSVEPITPVTVSITRMAATSEREKASWQTGEDNREERRERRTMGRKHIIPYGLYQVHGWVSAKLAERTGFSDADLALLWEGFGNMFEHDHSAARGEMAARKLIVFKHASALGNAQSHALFDRVSVSRNVNGEAYPVGDQRLSNLPPARRWADYRVEIDRDGMPGGVEVLEML